jgi:hypothetical protein
MLADLDKVNALEKAGGEIRGDVPLPKELKMKL